MQFKTLFKNQNSSNGLTLIELMVAVAIIVVLVGVSYSLMSSSDSKARARDNRRISDISNLDRVISEYRMDNNNSYPGVSEVVYTSIALPAGSTSLYAAVSGWVPVDISDYAPKYPLDPINDATYYYEYTYNTNGYEISTRLEHLLDVAASDGGDDPLKYEVGNNLLLITP